MTTLKIRAFRAPDEPDTCRRFIEGHRHVLEIYDIKMITSNRDQWVDHKNTYVIVAEDVDNNKIVGGARIQVADEDMQLPIEEAVGLVDENIYSVVAEHKKQRTGEICALWNSREIAGYRIGSIYLGWTGVALSRILKLNSLFALCAPATVRYCTMVGFETEKTLGNDGFFNYPKLNLVATAMIIKDIDNLPHTEESVKNTIAGLCDNPYQSIIFETPKGPINVHYDLGLKQLEAR